MEKKLPTQKTISRCPWADPTNQQYIEYHDNEWGVEVHDDRLLFEMLILEGAQAGLSWSTVLKKRAAYKKAFDNFDVKKIASYNQIKIDELMNNSGIIRNRLKIASTIRNAKVFMDIQKEYNTFDTYLWSFVKGKQITNKPQTMKDIQVKTAISDAISADLKKRGMNFVGSTIIYAYMQAVGLVDDHLTSCFKCNKR